MPYSITTKDGITINNIPDDVKSDSQVLKDRVAALRSGTAPSAKPAGAGIPEAIPGANARLAASNAAITAQGPKEDPTFVDKLIGGGETALSLATGATGGALGMLGGAAAGLVGNLTNGKYGMKDGVEQGMLQGADSLTYSPRTEKGQEYTGAVGDVIANTLPAIPMTAELALIGNGAKTGTAAATGAARAGAAATKAALPEVAKSVTAGVDRIKAMSPAIAERVQRTLNRTPDTPTPGTRASGGSAGTDIAAQRIANATDLPVPIKLTRGQATRDQSQLRFELETAKGEKGQALRDRYSDQNEAIVKNFDAWVDQTGAEAPNLRSVGSAVDRALVEKAGRDKAEVRAAYKAAENSAESAAPVQLDDLVAHLNDSIPDVATAPIIDTATKRAIRLGVASQDGDGNLVAKPVSLRVAEAMRQSISQAADPAHAPNLRQATIIKGLIDAQTEEAGGPLYRQARALRSRYATQYENRGVIRDLLRTDRGTQDRKVALEDVWSHSIAKGSLDDVRQVRKVLQTGGENGQQAWKELQGQTLNWLRDQATSNSATDQRGNAIFSAPKLHSAMRQLDADGKLDFVFGKQGAQQLRDINDLSKVVFTAPPGVVNTSNTASVILSALGESAAAGAIVGIPAPILTGLKYVHGRAKDRALAKRVNESLNNPMPR